MNVYPGDKVDIEVWSYYDNTSGFGLDTTAAAMTSLIASAFGGVSGAGGESGKIFAGISSAIGGYGLGPYPGSTAPAAFLNYILFDKNYSVINMGYQPVPANAPLPALPTPQLVSIPQVLVSEPGYIFVYLSYEDETLNVVEFDDFKITYTPTAVVQYNEYYPFGLQTQNSWTRVNSSNNFLYNSGSELNSTSGWYDTPNRGYDPTLGRFMQVDPMAASDHSISPYHYARNNPVALNDPTGLYPALSVAQTADQRRSERFWAMTDRQMMGVASSFWSDEDLDYLWEQQMDALATRTHSGMSHEEYSAKYGGKPQSLWFVKSNKDGMRIFTDQASQEAYRNSFDGIKGEKGWYGSYRFDNESIGSASLGSLTFTTSINFENNLSGPHLGQTFVDKKGSSFTPNPNGGYDINIKLVIYLQKARVLSPKFNANNPTIDLQLLAHEMAHVSAFKEAYLGKVNILGEMNSSGLSGQALRDLFAEKINYGSNEGQGRYTEYQTTLRGQQFLPPGVNMNYLLDDSTINWK